MVYHMFTCLYMCTASVHTSFSHLPHCQSHATLFWLVQFRHWSGIPGPHLGQTRAESGPKWFQAEPHCLAYLGCRKWAICRHIRFQQVRVIGCLIALWRSTGCGGHRSVSAGEREQQYPAQMCSRAKVPLPLQAWRISSMHSINTLYTSSLFHPNFTEIKKVKLFLLLLIYMLIFVEIDLKENNSGSCHLKLVAQWWCWHSRQNGTYSITHAKHVKQWRMLDATYTSSEIASICQLILGLNENGVKLQIAGDSDWCWIYFEL